MHKYFHFFRLAIFELFEYRVNFYWSIISIVISNLIIYIFWVAVLGSGFAKSDYTTSSIGLYFLIIALVGQMTAFSSVEISSAIKDGKISNSLLKPYNFALKTLMTTLDDKLFKCLVTIVIVYVFVNLGNLLVFSSQTPYFILSILLATAIKFFLGFTLGALAFWFSKVHGLSALFWNIGGLFSGEMIPPEFLPASLSTISNYLPFPYLAYFPARILTHSMSSAEIWFGISVQAAWLSLFYLIYRFVWHKGILHLESIGG